MPNARGWRRLFGVIGPSTNTIVQPDFDDLRVPGVTNHYSRIIVQDAKAISDESFMAGTLEISKNVVDAVKAVMTCKPDYLVMGMSAITFYGGIKGGEAFRKQVEDVSGVGLSIGSESLAAALRCYPQVKRVAFVSPYYPVANALVSQYLTESGYEVVRDVCLRCPTWTAISEVPETTLRDVLVNQLEGADVDALLQVGTNLSMVALAAAAEKLLAKPVIAINTATYWHALRANGIDDKVWGYGSLLEQH
jgi:maleate isomerase